MPEEGAEESQGKKSHHEEVIDSIAGGKRCGRVAWKAEGRRSRVLDRRRRQKLHWEDYIDTSFSLLMKLAAPFHGLPLAEGVASEHAEPADDFQLRWAAIQEERLRQAFEEQAEEAAEAGETPNPLSAIIVVKAYRRPFAGLLEEGESESIVAGKLSAVPPIAPGEPWTVASGGLYDQTAGEGEYEARDDPYTAQRLERIEAIFGDDGAQTEKGESRIKDIAALFAETLSSVTDAGSLDDKKRGGDDEDPGWGPEWVRETGEMLKELQRMEEDLRMDGNAS